MASISHPVYLMITVLDTGIKASDVLNSGNGHMTSTLHT